MPGAPRVRGDFSAYPLPEDELGFGPTGMTEDDLPGSAVDRDTGFAANKQLAGQLRLQHASQVWDHYSRFQDGLGKIIDELAYEWSAARDTAYPPHERERSRRRARGGIKLAYDKDGAVMLDVDDGGSHLGLTLGLDQVAINNALPSWMDYLFESAARPVEITALGDADESRFKERLVEPMLDDQRRLCDFKRVIREGLYDLMRYRMAIFRQRWVQKSRMRWEADGTLKERVSYEGTLFERWPIEEVLVSNWDKPNAKEQRTVLWWDSRELDELVAEEETFDIDMEAAEQVRAGGAIDPSQMFQTSGRFFSAALERLARQGYQMGDERQPSYGTGAFFNWRREGLRREWWWGQKATEIATVEAEGYLPMSRLVNSGAMGAEIVEYLNLPFASEVRSMSRRELSRAVDRIQWNVTIAQSGDLLECRANPCDPPETSLMVARYVPGEAFWDGQGIPDLGHPMTAVIDRLLNDNLWISMKRARPNYLVDTSFGFTTRSEDDEGGVRKLTMQEANALLRGIDAVVNFHGNGVNVDQLFKAVFPEQNQGWVEELALLIQQYKSRVMVTDALQGQSKSKTLGEAQQNLSQSLVPGQDRAQAFVEDIIVEFHLRAMRHMERFMPASGDPKNPGPWEKHQLKINGRGGTPTFFILPTLTDLWQQFIVTGSGAAVQNRNLRAQIIAEAGDRAFKWGVGDMVEYQEATVETLRFANPERFTKRGAEPVDPNLEIMALASNQYFEPAPGENFLEHLATHAVQLVAVRALMGEQDALATVNWQLIARGDYEIAISAFQQAAQISMEGGEPPGLERFAWDARALLPALERHYQQTEIAAATMMREQAQIEAQQAAGGGQAGGGAPAPKALGTTEQGMAQGQERRGNQNIQGVKRLGAPA